MFDLPQPLFNRWWKLLLRRWILANLFSFLIIIASLQAFKLAHEFRRPLTKFSVTDILMCSDSCDENFKYKNHVSWSRNFTRLLPPGSFNLTVLDTVRRPDDLSFID